ncbi:MAG: formate dehydrogenase [Pseudodesulfovibrio sp.]|uniref:Formate dehydrogenase beta subunit n=1 Tax=Pseudodesulfovibrio aespoeensis (strain ATCC 700646 / DSM 10631 / Aspo-2) TaxID=643562 RepID=E6VXI5_PSEA9|nr:MULTISPECIES: 4Fe-4S dicluster domain-containing protein [Pseudodesulfovibrio]MBU4378252.1 formate dehydrogenase [Pseudomonadota bacterium]ADU63801.1 formate dehydrogenase beta subunit [Pseudodesulfovibrio aespoeensis Aspo-2]MBU4475613.1 formate dehydrogenase [Pseudomonadota bacterium]MBU4515043.1 formate dehydrogenase [Pseudomonadota bacterium]MBU4520858.1 formate dehydrogenase [Pseudomonadota bacterium]
MNGKTFFVDLTLCTACRGCQVACKQWKKLPAEKTVNWGSYQNPKDLSSKTIRVVRFSEVEVDGKLRWLFFPEQCRHCIEPPCATVPTNPASIIHDPATGAVVYTDLTAKEDGEALRMSCPYDIPRVDPETKAVVKCDMCLDRVKAGMLPSCVQACPTGTMNFGDRDAMLELADKHLAEAKVKFPGATLIDQDSVRVIYLAAFRPASYYDYLEADASGVAPGPLTRKQLLAKLSSPVKRMIS